MENGRRGQYLLGECDPTDSNDVFLIPSRESTMNLVSERKYKTTSQISALSKSTSRLGADGR